VSDPAANDPAANKALVREFWAVPQDRKMEYVADDACWHLPTSVARRGFDQEVRGEKIRDLFLGSMERYRPDRTWDVHHVVAEDDLVALHVTMHARTNVDKEYHGSYHMLFRVEDGRIAEAWEFLDTAYVFECLAPDEEG
jgi:ketosteroid isomerase-like protein